MPRLSIGLEQVFTNLGIVGAGYKLYFFETNSTTPKTTYSDEGLTIPNTNPVVLNAAGRPDVGIWGSDPAIYRMVLGTPDSTISTVLLNPVVDVDPVDDLNTGSIIIFNPIPTAYWGTTEGTSTHYTLNPALVPITSYSNTQTFFIDFHIACGASPDLNINNLGAISLGKYKGDGTIADLEAGDVQAQRYIAINNGSRIVILNPEIVYNLKGDNLTATRTLNGSVFSVKLPTIANNGSDANNDIDFSAGSSFDVVNSIGWATTAKTKRLDAAWVAGNNQGGLDTGSKANSTFYNCFTIYDPTNNLDDCIFSTAAPLTGPTLPTNYTKFCYVGAIRTDGSGNIKTFNQSKNYFYRNLVADRTYAAAPNTTANLQTVEVPPNTIAILTGRVNSGSNNFFNIQSTFETDSVPVQDNAIAAAITGAFFYTQVLTNNSSQIRYRADSTGISFNILSRGWIDPYL